MTIFITSFNPFVTRNILFSDFFQVLKNRRDLRLVIFCPDYKIDYFKKNFFGANIVIEGVSTQKLSFQDVIFRYITASLIDNRTRYIHQKRELLKDKNYPRFLIARIFAKLGRSNLIKRVVRTCDRFFVSKKKFARFFDQYRPNLVFCPDVFHDDDVHFLAEAKHRGVKTIGMIRSWDNITNKGLFRMKPDKLIVNNEIIKDEAIKHEDVSAKDIAVVGMPQFDYYLNEPRSSREEFFKRINLDPKQRLVMFSPHGNRFHDTDWHIMQMLKEARLNGEIPQNIQFLVRFPPNDDVALGNFIPDDHFCIDKPAKGFQKNVYRDQELDRDAMVHLADSLYYSEAIITYNSSIIIDAAAFNKPAIGIAFDGWDSKPDIYRSVARFMDYDHTRYVLKTGGFPVVRSQKELIKTLQVYLENPNHNLENRRKIVDTQAWKFDGRAGERIAEFICSNLR